MAQSVESSNARGYVASALLGAASGMRSTAGIATVITQGDRESLPAPLRHRLAGPAARVAVAVELLLDKMPFTGSRLEPAGMAGRVVLSGAAGAVAARQHCRPVAPAVFIAIATASLTAKITHDLRARLAQKVPDRAGRGC